MNGLLKRGCKEIKQMLDFKFSEVLTVFFIYILQMLWCIYNYFLCANIDSICVSDFKIQ